LELALEHLENAAVRAEAAEAVKRIADSIKGAHPDAAASALRKLSE
jgi:hypothetical protein